MEEESREGVGKTRDRWLFGRVCARNETQQGDYKCV